MSCWSGSSPAGCLSIQVAATLSIMSDSLSLQSFHSMIVIFGLEDGGSDDVGYGYVISIMTVFTLPLVLIFVSVFLVYAYSSFYVQTQYLA
jgi:hypothetical protein